MATEGPAYTVVDGRHCPRPDKRPESADRPPRARACLDAACALKAGEELGRDRRFVRTADGEEDALYYWLFPNTMFNVYPDNMSSNLILPLGADRTLTIFEWFFAEPGSGAGWESMQQTIAFSDEIQQEDIAICEQVQRGLRSRAYDTGRVSAKRENGVFHFQQLVREFLGE